MRLLGMRDQAAQRCQAPGRGIGTRRHPVIGKAVPARQRQDGNIGGCKTQHLLDIGDPLAVRENIGNGTVDAGKFGKNQRLDAGRNGADGQLAGGARDFLGIETGNHQAFLSLCSNRTSKSGR